MDQDFEWGLGSEHANCSEDLENHCITAWMDIFRDTLKCLLLYIQIRMSWLYENMLPSKDAFNDIDVDDLPCIQIAYITRRICAYLICLGLFGVISAVADKKCPVKL